MEPASNMRHCYGGNAICLAVVMAISFVSCKEESQIAQANYSDGNPAVGTLSASAVREEVNEVVLRARPRALLCGDMMRSHPDAKWPNSGERITLTADMLLHAKGGKGLVEQFSVNPSTFTIPEEVRSCIEQAYLAGDVSFATDKGDFHGRLELPMCIHPPTAEEETEE